jgi:hypothetical protein
MKRVLSFAVVLVAAACSVHAESRDPESPFTPQQLHEMSTLVFEGTVVAIETNAERKGSFPTKATVDAVLKGKLEAKELPLTHKSPGKWLILEKEYNTPQVGQNGAFYIEDQGGTLVLIGYIKKIEHAAEQQDIVALTNYVGKTYQEMYKDLGSPADKAAVEHAPAHYEYSDCHLDVDGACLVSAPCI